MAVAEWTPIEDYKGWTSPDGNFFIGGDMEINFDVFSNKNGVNGTTLPTRDNRGLTNTQIGDDSRFLLRTDWRNTRDDGSFVTARADSLLKTNGQLEMDDTYFAFGVQDSWMFQIGRYEAMDLFPLGKDVAVFYAAGSDGIGQGVYYYMAKEARGRSGKAGQARIATKMSNWTAEVSTVYGDTLEVLSGSDIYLDDKNRITSKNNSFMVRPVINYLSDTGFLSVSFGGEAELNNDSVTIADSNNNRRYDLANRYGLAATATLNFGDLIWHNSFAHQDAKELWKAETFNSNIEYGRFGLGGSFAKNKHIDKGKEDTKSYVLYTAYTVPVLNFDNAEVTFALSHSKTDNAYGVKNNDEETTAFRTRFNYYF
ncbi:hypothetical protein GZ77_26655 [Endozoicomonas montiporae]|uniref:Porin n=2 Tax=Endozoicomonas montiporae TaxID=1027273 RepID=A0A081MYD6_9GAMM|nr:hypothetical protein GZ77_26655 [Endozoicomonas montiporae]